MDYEYEDALFWSTHATKKYAAKFSLIEARIKLSMAQRNGACDNLKIIAIK